MTCVPFIPKGLGFFFYIYRTQEDCCTLSAERGHNKRLFELCKDEQDAVNKLIWRASSRVDLSSLAIHDARRGKEEKNDWGTFSWLTF